MFSKSRLCQVASIALGASLLIGCDRSQGEAGQGPGTTIASGAQEVSTLTVFDLSPTEKTALAERALGGDAEASFRLAQFYSLAGGDGDPNVNDEHDHREELRWLELAAEQGHPAGEFNLAVVLAKDDCPRARSIMTKIRDGAAESRRRDSAASWLRDPRFAC